METINKNPILDFNKNQLQEVRKLFGYESVSAVNKAVDTFEEWIEKQNHFVVRKFDRNYLERLLLASKGSTERAKKHLDKICTARTLSPEFTMNFKIKREFEDYFGVSYNFFLPKPTPEHYRVCVTKLYNENYDKFSLVDFYRYMILMVEYILNNDYATGSIIIVDFEHINFSLISKVNPMTVERGRSVIVDGYGMKVKALYMINSSTLLDKLVTVIKQGFSAKLRSRVHTLSSPEGLHKYLPKDILPSDYGGQEACIQELHDRTFNELCSESNLNKVKEMENAVTDESCRLACDYNEEVLGMPGSFKSLNVD